MILIRGIKGEQFARKIENGVVDCRDVLSTLLEPPVTGYEYSDYYEKNLVKALSYCWNGEAVDIHNPDFLYSLLIDFYIPHIYLTFFHILNNRSLEWLDKFDDDYRFIAMNVAIDRITKTTIGKEYFGARMEYVNSIRELKQDGSQKFYAACMCSLEELFENKREMAFSLNIYNTLAFPLLCREQDDKFTDIENEFRIMTYECPRVKNGMLKQIPRDATIIGKSGIRYKGVLNPGNNTIFASNMYALQNPNKSLKDVLNEEGGMITLDSVFKSININDISDDYGYIGGKKECAEFIKEMLVQKPKEIYVDRTVLKEYKIDELSNIRFAKGYRKVEYSDSESVN